MVSRKLDDYANELFTITKIKDFVQTNRKSSKAMNHCIIRRKYSTNPKSSCETTEN